MYVFALNFVAKIVKLICWFNGLAMFVNFSYLFF